MVVRNYGVKNAAGVGVTEQDVQGPITPGRFGTGNLTGKLEKGEPLDPIILVGPKQMKRKVGGRIAGSIVPDGIEDYWRHSNNSGLMVAIRVTDGLEQKAGLMLMSRHTGVAFLAPNYAKGEDERVIQPVLGVEAKNGGRWAGRYRAITNTAVNVVASLTETTVDTGLTMLKDELVGGNVILDGTHSLSGKLYEIISNTIAGVITVRTGSTMLSDVNETVQVTIVVTALLAPINLGANKRKGFALLLKEGTLGGGLEFGLDMYLDGDRVYGWDSLSMDPDSPRYAVTVINNDAGNEEIVVTDMLQSGVVISEYNRPGNYTRMVTDSTATRVWFQPVLIEQNDVPVSIIPVGYEVVAGADDTPTGVLTGKMIFTWDDANSKYLVTYEINERYGIVYGVLPDLTPGAPPVYEVEYDPGTAALPKITIDHFSDPADLSEFVVQVMPVRPEVIGGMAYPDTDSAKFNGFVVRDTTHDSVTVESGDPSAVGVPGAVGGATGTVNEPFTFVLDTDDEMKISVDGRTSVDVKFTAGVGVLASVVVGEINDAFDLIFGVGVLNPAVVVADVLGDKVSLVSAGGFDGTGPGSFVTLIDPTAGDFPAYTVLGFTVPASTSVHHRGTSGTRARIEYLQEMADGYDGDEPSLAKYIAAYATNGGPFGKIAGRGYGNIMMNVPGITDRLTASEVVTLYKQIVLLGETGPYTPFLETPIDKVDEADIQAYWEDTVGRSDMLGTWIPSLRDITDPDAVKRLKRVSSIPAVMGLWAKVSVANKGYHHPAAGPDMVLQRTQQLPDGFDSLNEEFLTPGGYNVIKLRGGEYVVWGARTLFENSLWKFMTNRLQMNHYVWTFLDNYDWVIFRLNDKITWKEIEAATKDYLDKEYAKRVLTGDSVEDAYSIKIDADNNPQGEIDVGTAHMDLEFNFTKFIERLKISVGAGGVSEAS